MPSDTAAQIVAKLIEACRAGFIEAGPQVVASVQQEISVPVQYVGGRVIRSNPGEPPRKEFGVYQASVVDQVYDAADGPALSVYTPMQRGAWLKFGTARIQPRPHFEPTQARIDIVTQAIARNITRANS